MPTSESLRLRQRLAAALRAFRDEASGEALYAPFRALQVELGEGVRAYPYTDPETGKRGILVYHQKRAVIPSDLLKAASHVEEVHAAPKAKKKGPARAAKPNTLRSSSFGTLIPEPTLPPEPEDTRPPKTRFELLLEDED